jgi:UDP-N-acetylmuramoylalanine-D-glutamate ligase
MQKIILSLLSLFARAIIMRHKPYVIGVTGSIGKTTLTTYISEYLRLIYGESAVGVSPYHYNGEY